MPPKKDCGLILFDLNSSKKQILLETLIRFAVLKWYALEKDIYRLILFNASGSDNELNLPNLCTADLDELEPKEVRACIENAEVGEGNWLDALELGIHHLKEVAGIKEIENVQLIFFTTLDNYGEDSSNKVNKIISDLNKCNIKLYIIGPNIELPLTIRKQQDVATCMKQIDLDESLKSVEKIIQSTNGSVICNPEIGLHLLFSFRNKGNYTQPWKVPLTLRPNLEIPAITMKVFRKEEFLELSQIKEVGSQSVLVEDESVQIDKEDQIAGLKYHEQFVIEADNNMFKIRGPRRFQLIGFTDKKFVPEIFMGGGDETFYVLPHDEGTMDSCYAFIDLIDVLSEEQKYAVVNRVYNQNNKPKYFVLIPRSDLYPKCFVMTELPYADYIFENHKFTEPKRSDTLEKDDDTYKFLQSLDIESSECKVNVPLLPEMMLDLSSNEIAIGIVKKLLDNDLEFINTDIDRLIQSENNDLADVLKDSWPVS